MRRVRIVAGLASVVCALGAFAAPALAKKEVKEVVFGKFVASIPGGTISSGSPVTAAGHGELTSLDLAKGALSITNCEKPLKSTGKVESESSNTFLQIITFARCFSKVGINHEVVEERKVKPFKLAMEFHSNHSVVAGESAPSEVKIVTPSTVTIPVAKGAACVVVIPAQTIPTKAERKPELEYEAASYETEVETGLNPKKFPGGFQDKLNIEMEFNKIEAWLKPGAHCTYSGGTEGRYDNEEGTPAYGYVVYTNGTLEAELEEITIKGGNLAFEPAKE